MRPGVRWFLSLATVLAAGGEREVLIAEIEAWQRQRNASGMRIKWKFTTQRARSKLARAYPDTAKESQSM